MLTKAAFLLLGLVGGIAQPAHSYGTSTHKDIVVSAVSSICASKERPEWCRRLKAQMNLLKAGSEMEDECTPDAEVEGLPGACSEPARVYKNCSLRVGGKTHPYCNHYWFSKKDPLLKGYEGSDGACGRHVLGATSGDIKSYALSTCWDSLLSRGVELWDRAVKASAKGDSVHAYYWLGRVAHLLADAGVPGHVVPHDATTLMELEHRCYEAVALGAPAGVYQRWDKKGDQKHYLFGLFDGLRGRAVRKAYYRETNAELDAKGKAFLGEVLTVKDPSGCNVHAANKMFLGIQRKAADELTAHAVSRVALLLQMFMAQNGVPDGKGQP